MSDPEKPGAGIIGQRVGGDPKDEAEHFAVCPECKQAFDMRSLDQVIHHNTPGHAPIGADG